MRYTERRHRRGNKREKEICQGEIQRRDIRRGDTHERKSRKGEIKRGDIYGKEREIQNIRRKDKCGKKKDMKRRLYREKILQGGEHTEKGNEKEEIIYERNYMRREQQGKGTTQGGDYLEKR